MTLEGMKKFMNALKEAGIKNWECITDINTHYYNNDHAVSILDEADNALYNFAGATGNSSAYEPGSIVVKGANLADIHEVRFGVKSSSDIDKFLKAMGLSLDKDQKQIVINIYGSNYKLMPQTGDYLVFKELSEDEIAKLSVEEMAKYNKDLEDYKNKNKMQSPVQVTV